MMPPVPEMHATPLDAETQNLLGAFSGRGGLTGCDSENGYDRGGLKDRRWLTAVLFPYYSLSVRNGKVGSELGTFFSARPGFACLSLLSSFRKGGESRQSHPVHGPKVTRVTSVQNADKGVLPSVHADFLLMLDSTHDIMNADGRPERTAHSIHGITVRHDGRVRSSSG